MIAGKLTEKGVVVLSARSRREFVRILGLDYVGRRGKLGLTWWPYMADLHRDLEGEIVWTPSTKVNLAKLMAAVRSMSEGDDAEIQAVFSSDRQPYPFQMEAIHAGLNMHRLVLADSTGLGKTIEALGIMLAARARGEVRRSVIVAPSGLMKQWYGEIVEFALDPPKTVVVTGGPASRRLLYKKAWETLIISPGILKGDLRRLERVIDQVDLVAIDEASSIRNAETDIARDVKYLFAKTKYRLALTATPVENKLHDLRSIVEFVEPRVFISENYFNKRYIVWRKKRFTAPNGKVVRKQVPARYRNLGEVRAKIRPCYIRRTVSEVGLELPELIVKWEVLKLPKRQRKVYDAVRERLDPVISGLRGEALRAPLQALRQACNSTALVEKKGASSKPTQIKVVRLLELLDTDLAGEQVLIFTDYERFGSLLVKALKEHRPVAYTGLMTSKARQRAVDAFRLGDRRVFVGTKALERGHNLQNAAVVLNIDLPYNPARLKQRIGRVRRLGSEHATCVSINFIAEDTVEDRLILRRLYEKREIFEDVFGEDELSDADPIESMSGESLRGLL